MYSIIISLKYMYRCVIFFTDFNSYFISKSQDRG